MNQKIDRCRKCKHVELVHSVTYLQCNNGWLLKPNGTFANAACHCTGYEPLDNLEFLEMKYGQRFSL